MSEKLLTIGMSTYDDFDGVIFSIQALRLYHKVCETDLVEFVLIDNNPDSAYGQTCKDFFGSIKGKYIPYTEKRSSFNKYKVVEHATGKYVVIIDSHVLLAPDALDYLLEYYKSHPNCKDLVQGPLVYDDLTSISTHFDPVFRGDMYGIWAKNKELYEKGEPFEIPMQGMGCLSFERTAWPGIHPNIIGFGAEEGYIAEKFRQNGGKNICLPQLLWWHRFGRPAGVKFPLALEDRVWNYFIGWYEIYKDPNHKMMKDIYNHFKDKLPKGRIDIILDRALRGERSWQ